MIYPKQFLIDGIDRLGKSTLADNLLDKLGYYLMIHYGKPKRLKYYDCAQKTAIDSVRDYQTECNKQMFKLIRSNAKIIFDRTHLGEMVYAPLYRGYSGDYVYLVEQEYPCSNARLILLTTSDFNLCEDDGKSFDFNNKVTEQQSFLKAFNLSSIQDKVIIDVHDGSGKFKSPEVVLKEALKESD